MNTSKLICAFLVLSTIALAQAPTKKTGAVAGSVTCADTNAPARFAVVTLERVPPEASAAAAGKVTEGSEDLTANATATTDLEGRFVLEKVPVGQYYVLGSLTGYLNPLARFSPKQLREMNEETRKELAAEVPVVTVAPNQAATANLRLEHAATVEGTVLYDDGSPAVGLRVQLMRREKDGTLVEARSELLDGLSVFGSHAFTDDRGRYEMTGTAPGEYVVRASLPSIKVSVTGLLGGRGASIGAMSNSGGELEVYSGNVFRGKEAKPFRVGRGDQTGGADITIPLDGLHQVVGTVVAKRDGHALGSAHVQLLYADDRTEVRTTEVQDASGSFVFSYVPNGQYIVRMSNAADVETVEHHEFNSNWTEDKVIRKYGESELPVMVEGDVSDVELDAPDLAQNKASKD